MVPGLDKICGGGGHLILCPPSSKLWGGGGHVPLSPLDCAHDCLCFQCDGFVSNTGRRESRVFLCSKGRLGRKSTRFWKITLPHWNSATIQTPYPKLMIMCHFVGKLMFYKWNTKQFCFIDDVHEINNQSRCILSGPPCIDYLTDKFLSACTEQRTVRKCPKLHIKKKGGGVVTEFAHWLMIDNAITNKTEYVINRVSITTGYILCQCICNKLGFFLCVLQAIQVHTDIIQDLSVACNA